MERQISGNSGSDSVIKQVNEVMVNKVNECDQNYYIKSNKTVTQVIRSEDQTNDSSDEGSDGDYHYSDDVREDYESNETTIDLKKKPKIN